MLLFVVECSLHHFGSGPTKTNLQAPGVFIQGDNWVGNLRSVVSAEMSALLEFSGDFDPCDALLQRGVLGADMTAVLQIL